ncbi:hypothetical protein AtubIFM55763_002153 [Aspergillus tubingensis]|uniref:Unnamed protein product n=2 Tax=Aspergillus subgen. Circumdati TaxID=2720871 RepID=A0A100IQE4_ASPNG|nr:unnamed protein product [Aspergillus niger]GLA71673.1 hypothetical protein AtubIFM55763_002153 [Aspergillus tubingensis]GLA87018.1 hypothetical protein AtubIFM56815_011289 [Aspergillus tubingensis]
MTRKRKVVNEEIQEEEQSAPIFNDQMRKLVQEAFLGTALLDVRELDEAWKEPYPNRKVDPTHVKSLEESFKHGIKHTSPECRMKVSITRADWQGLLNETAERFNKEDDTSQKPTTERPIDKWSGKILAQVAFDGLSSLRFKNQVSYDLTLLPAQSNNNTFYNFTLDAGQHRKYALLKLIKTMAARRKAYEELPVNEKANVSDIPPENMSKEDKFIWNIG